MHERESWLFYFHNNIYITVFCISPRATEPKIPSLVIPKLSPNCCLKLANFSKLSCNLTITCIFSCCKNTE